MDQSKSIVQEHFSLQLLAGINSPPVRSSSTSGRPSTTKDSFSTTTFGPDESPPPLCEKHVSQF